MLTAEGAKRKSFDRITGWTRMIQKTRVSESFLIGADPAILSNLFSLSPRLLPRPPR
jgi:hypothetical protein